MHIDDKMFMSIYKCVQSIMTLTYTGTEKYHKVSKAYHKSVNIHEGQIHRWMMVTKWSYPNSIIAPTFLGTKKYQ